MWWLMIFTTSVRYELSRLTFQLIFHDVLSNATDRTISADNALVFVWFFCFFYILPDILYSHTLSIASMNIKFFFKKEHDGKLYHFKALVSYGTYSLDNAGLILHRQKRVLDINSTLISLVLVPLSHVLCLEIFGV